MVTVFTRILVLPLQGIAGSLALLTDFMTGRFDKMGTDVGAIFNGLVDMIKGALNTINSISGGALSALAGLFGLNFGKITSSSSSSMDTTNKNVSKSAASMSKSVQDSFSSMEGGSSGQVQVLSDTATRLFKQMYGNCSDSMSKLDQSTISYWNDIAGYIDQKSKEAMLAANENLGKISINYKLYGNINSVANKNINDPTSGDIPDHASGTNYSPGGLHWLGENQPELVIGRQRGYVPRGASVVPLSSMGGGSGGWGSGGRSGPVQINVQVDKQTLASVLVNDIMELAARQTRVRHGSRTF